MAVPCHGNLATANVRSWEYLPPFASSATKCAMYLSSGSSPRRASNVSVLRWGFPARMRSKNTLPDLTPTTRMLPRTRSFMRFASYLRRMRFPSEGKKPHFSVGRPLASFQLSPLFTSQRIFLLKKSLPPALRSTSSIVTLPGHITHSLCTMSAVSPAGTVTFLKSSNFTCVMSIAPSGLLSSLAKPMPRWSIVRDPSLTPLSVGL